MVHRLEEYLTYWLLNLSAQYHLKSGIVLKKVIASQLKIRLEKKFNDTFRVFHHMLLVSVCAKDYFTLFY